MREGRAQPGGVGEHTDNSNSLVLSVSLGEWARKGRGERGRGSGGGGAPVSMRWAWVHRHGRCKVMVRGLADRMWCSFVKR